MTEMPAIAEKDIEAAERLLGVVYTPRERAQMAGNLSGQIASAQARRQVDLPNTGPMASRFDPRLPTFRMPAMAPTAHSSMRTGRTLPDDEEDLAFAPMTVLAGWIQSGQITSRRLTEIYLARIEALNPRLECFAVVTPDLALAEADAADALSRAGVNLGPLHGIPYGLKDLFDTRGIVTGWGAEPYQHRMPDADARVVTLLRRAGGKWRRKRNWDPTLSAGREVGGWMRMKVSYVEGAVSSRMKCNTVDG